MKEQQMSTTEQEFLWKLTEVLGECEELKEMIPDEWPEEARDETRGNIDLAMMLLKTPHKGLSVMDYSPEDGSCEVLRISKDPPGTEPEKD